MSNMSPAKFVREIRQEMGRVTWPTRRETTISAIMVIALASLAAVFFLVADWFLGSGIRFIIGIGG